MIRSLTTLYAGLVALPLSAQDLSPSEQDAMAERALSAAEVSAREASCALDLTPQTEPAADGTYIITLPVIAVLPLIYGRAATNADADDVQILQYDPLPNGGIAAQDICGIANVDAITRIDPGSVIATIGVRLRPDLDLGAGYPNTSLEIRRREQLVLLPAGRYKVHPATDNSAARARVETLRATADPATVSQRFAVSIAPFVLEQINE